MPNQQPPAVYPSSQQYQSAVPPRPVADQSLMFRQPPPQLPPAPQGPPSHFISSPPQQPPPQSPQPQQHAPLHPSHIHPPIQTSIPPPHHNTGGAPPLQQSFQSRPQYQVQSAPHPAQVSISKIFFFFPFFFLSFSFFFLLSTDSFLLLFPPCTFLNICIKKSIYKFWNTNYLTQI